MKKTFAFFFGVLFFASASGVTADTLKTTAPDIWRNHFFLQAGGEGVMLTINYERCFKISNKSRFSARIGIGPVPDFSSAFIPLTVSKITGKKNCFEYGLGVTFIPAYNESIALTANLSYRYFARKGFTFKAGLVLLYIPQGFLEFLPWPSVGFGYSF